MSTNVIDDSIITHNSDVFITNTTVKPSISVDELIAFLCEKRVTGEVRVILNQGGKRQILVTEQTKLKESERDIIRHSLGMTNGKLG